MQFLSLAVLAAALPHLAIAGPIAADSPLEKRGIDICGSYRFVGDTCNYGPGGNQPHACSGGNDRAIVSVPHLYLAGHRSW